MVLLSFYLTVLYDSVILRSMTRRIEKLWPIGELTRRVSAALSVGYEGPANGQISAVPNLRTIRYYTTLGILDRATVMKGRTALYSRKHLLQLVTIKRLQSEGLSLTQVQHRLSGMTERELESLATIELPDEVGEEPEDVETGSTSARRFWATVPDDATPIEALVESEPWNGATARTEIIQGIDVGEGVTTLIRSSRGLVAEDVEAIRAAAEPLLRVLKERGLIQ